MKPVLVTLHGVSGSAGEMAPLAKPLSAWFDVRVPNLLGHGGRHVPDGCTLQEMVGDLVAWLDQERIGPAHFLGYSLGGYLALYLARHQPQRVKSMSGIVVKHVFDEAALSYIAYLADPNRLGRPGNPRKDELIAVHGEANWINVTKNTASLFESFGRDLPLDESDLRGISIPTLILSGDRDPLVSEAETRALAALLPNARLGLFPGPSHPLRMVPLLDAVRAIKTFIDEVEQDRFTPGAPLKLGSHLVMGGIPNADVRVTVGKAKN